MPMICNHHNKPSMYSDSHVCAECFAKDFALQLGSVPYTGGKGHDYEYHGPLILGADGKTYREQRLK